jgi:hypothetical protein
MQQAFEYEWKIHNLIHNICEFSKDLYYFGRSLDYVDSENILLILFKRQDGYVAEAHTDANGLDEFFDDGSEIPQKYKQEFLNIFGK